MIRNKQLNTDGTIVENGMNDFHFREFVNFCLTTSKPKSTCEDLRNFVDCETKPASVRTELIEFFTKEEERILDVFSGKGSTLNICSDLFRKAVGIDGSSSNHDFYTNSIRNDSFLNIFPFFVGDALKLLSGPALFDEKFDFIMIDPPVFKSNAVLESELLDTKPFHKYTEYLIELLIQLQFHLKEDKYMVLILQDVYSDSSYKHLPSFILPHIVSLTFVGIKIYYRDISVRVSGGKSYAPLINHFYALIFKNNG